MRNMMDLTKRKQTYNVELTILIMHAVTMLFPTLTFRYTEIQLSFEGALQTLHNHGEVWGINEKYTNGGRSKIIDIGFRTYFFNEYYWHIKVMCNNVIIS